MSQRRIDPPDYRGAAFLLGASAIVVGFVSPGRVVAFWLTLIGAAMVVASRKLEDIW